jgi:two-component system CheB/CheR fusion protein
MLGNLLSNGIRYTHAGTVRLACQREGDTLAITIHDTGVGMPRAELGKIFDEFYQIDLGSRRPEGLGLGLSIVRRLAALLGHEIHVDSGVGEGTEFTVKVARADLEPSVARATAAVGVHSRARLLLIEDEAPVAHAMSLLLEIEGFDVQLASCKSEALEHVSSTVPDLVISDYHLRGTETGAQVVNEIRARLGTPIPAIFLTGDTGKLAAAGDLLGGATLLSKPTRADELLAAIHEHIARATVANIRR